MTNTNKMEVLFQELGDEDIASISGGSSTATVTVSGNSSSAKAQTITSTPTPTPTPAAQPSSPTTSLITPFFDPSPVNSLFAGNYTVKDGNGISITVSLS